MRIDILTLLPEIFNGPFNQSIVKRAQEKKLVDICLHNIRDYSTDKHKSADDYAFGGGAGMVMMIEPIAACIEKLKSERKYDYIIYTTPDGKTLNQKTANKLSLAENIMILCGHYKGVDQRVRDLFIDMEVSIGDYVLSGGELAAAVISDASSALSDSFQDNLLAPPVYTRPAEFRGLKVPEVLLSGHHDKIEDWRHEQSIQRTKLLRPDLLDEM
jgi:tRNA (guanine37-N1)-methyltransferase